MISVDDGSEFTVLIADFIRTLASTENFKLRVWLNGSELPFEFYKDTKFYFMQEGFRASYKNNIIWIFYDTINIMRVDYDKIE